MSIENVTTTLQVDAAHGYSDFPDLEQLARLATTFASD
jgi:hypothetical protein